jgi:membrane peptidoglycan carboxypeptidase
VSNPDNPDPYWQEPSWQEPVGAGRRGTRGGPGREDPHARDGYGHPGGNGRSNGGGRSNGSRVGNGRPAGYERTVGNGVPNENGGRDGYGDNGSRGPGYGRGRPRGSGRGGPAPGGYERGSGRGGYGADGGYPTAGGGWAGRASQVGRDLRSRLGLGTGAQDTVGLGGPGGTRAATGLRERGTSTRATGRFAITERMPGTRRAGGPGSGGPGDGSNGGARKRRKGSWWRHWSWRKVLAVLASAIVGMFLIFAAVVVYYYEKTQIPTEVSELALQQSSTVYFSDGKTQVGTFSANGIDRQMLTSSQIPAVMKNAIVAAEDRNFYHEGGISITGIMRSAYQDLFGSGGLQGGSTLTQEFAKNYYTTIGTSRSISTKIKEIFVSIKLSKEKSKDWIMTQYLNTVSFGNNAYGVAAAAQIYFNEPATNLTVSQAAMLAALVNRPGTFTPDPNGGEGYTALVARWQYVLTNMARDGAITQQQAAAQKFPKVSKVNQLAVGWTGFKGYIMSAVLSELQHRYPAEAARVDTGGLKIVTTISLQKMQALYRAVNENLAQLKADGTPLPWYAHVGAVLEQPGTGDILAFYGGPNYGLNATNPKYCLRIDCQLNMAMQNREQVGSSFKPYVLSTAVHEGMNVSNSILNAYEPMCVPQDSPLSSQLQLSAPTTNCPVGFEVNIPGENMGALSVPQGAAVSSDPGFEDLVHRAGTQATIDMAKAFGVDVGGPAPHCSASGLQCKVHQVGIALGIGSLTVEEQATTFATLANGGVYVTPHVIAQIVDNGSIVPLNVTRRQVLSAAEAADVDYALSFDTNCNAPWAGPPTRQGGFCGTAVPGGQLNTSRPTIGKTGTTDDFQSAFFLGAIPQYSLAVGMFTNEQDGKVGGESLGGLPPINGQSGGGFGGAWPTNIWRTFMNNEFSGLPVRPLPTPNFSCCTASGQPFVKWNQVPKQPRKPKHHHSHSHNPNPNPSPGCKHHHLGCPPTGPPSPTPTIPNPKPTVPNPNPTAPNPTTGAPVAGPVIGLNAAGTGLLLTAAEDPTATTVPVWRPGGV